MDRDDRARSRAFSRTAPCKSLKPPNHVQKPALAGAAPIWWSPRRRLTLPARLPSDISTLQSEGHLNLVATPLLAHSGHSRDRRRRLPRLGWQDNIGRDGRELLTKLGPTAPIGSFLKGFVRLRPMLVLWHAARPGWFARLAYPDLSIRVQTSAAGRRNGGEARAMQQAGVGLPAGWMGGAGR